MPEQIFFLFHLEMVRFFRALFRLSLAEFSTTSSKAFPEPLTFGSRFRLPELPDKPDFLSQCNPHPRDSLVLFDSAKHTYFCDGQPVRISVTKAVDTFFEKFDPDIAVSKMMTGPNWPRPEYTVFLCSIIFF